MRFAPRRRLGITSVDLVVCLAVLLLISSFSFAQIARARETANRIKCASNLKMLGMAILLYSNENRGAYPRAVATAPLKQAEHAPPVWGTPYEGKKDLVPPDQRDFVADPFVLDKPVDDKDKALIPYRPEKNDVTAALFLLLRTQDISSEVFVCPTTPLTKFEYGGSAPSALRWTNWPGKAALRDHLSYSYQNPYPSADAIGQGFKLNNSISAEFATMSDMNPGGDALTKLTPKLPMREMRNGNSYNHDRDGQNVLFGDGHVDFMANPFAGVKRDNIFTYGDSGNDVPDKGGDGIVGSPVGPNDSILLPTARDVGQVDEQGNFLAAGAAKWAKPTPQQADALREKLIGEYEQTAPNGAAAALKVTKDQIIATSGPITITFGYTIDGLAGDQTRLALTAPQTRNESATIKVAPNGDLVITKNPYYEGQWKRKR